MGFDYDGFSNLLQLDRFVGMATHSTTYEYDDLNRHTLTTDPLNRDTEMTYEPFCVEFSELTARGVERTYSFDVMCRMSPLYEYDELGRLVKVRQEKANDIVYQESVPSSLDDPQARWGSSKYQEDDPLVEERHFLYDELDR
ncbi:MAG: hypothetical protein AB7S38_39535 [Vulcanimicrobiota bacterium]